MPALPTAVASVHSFQGFPRWLLVTLLLLLVVSFIINIIQGRQVTRLRRELLPEGDYEFPGWGDGKDVMDAITDPGLEPVPTYGFVRDIEPELAHDEPTPDTVIFGRIVDEDHWAEEAAIPAPEIVANPVHTQKALEWIAQWEAEDAARQEQGALVGAP